MSYWVAEGRAWSCSCDESGSLISPTLRHVDHHQCGGSPGWSSTLYFV